MNKLTGMTLEEMIKKPRTKAEVEEWALEMDPMDRFKKEGYHDGTAYWDPERNTWIWNGFTSSGPIVYAVAKLFTDGTLIMQKVGEAIKGTGRKCYKNKNLIMKTRKGKISRCATTSIWKRAMEGPLKGTESSFWFLYFPPGTDKKTLWLYEGALSRAAEAYGHDMFLSGQH